MDIDVDLSPSLRPKILENIREELGDREKLLTISTFNTEGSRSSVLTACRGLGIDNDTAQYIASLIPQERMQLYSLEDCLYGNEEKGRKPVKEFINEVSKYPKLEETMLNVCGLINSRSMHPAGIVFTTERDLDDYTAYFTNDKNEIVSQFDLGDTEYQGLIKYDFLVTNMIDKITVTLKLLREDGYFSLDKSIRDIYNEILHPEVINLDDNRIWEALGENSVLDIFQFNSPEGLKATKYIKPKDILQMTSANALMRLQGEEGKERPIDRYVRLKDNMELWYQECRDWGLTEEEIKVLEPYYLVRGGVPAFQEDLMQIVMNEKVSNFTLKESNNARKTVAKKKTREVDALYSLYITKGKESGNRKVLLDYVWETCLRPQMNYSFSLLHSLAYSFIGVQSILLGINYPLYWACAVLITESGSISEDDTTKYGKMATAIGMLKNHGISVELPNINKSKLGFSVVDNKILYGLKAISKINDEAVNLIIENRPFNSFGDFYNKMSEKIEVGKIINLIKAGAFDELEGRNRLDIMSDYIKLITKPKTTLTSNALIGLINQNVVPEIYSLEARMVKFRKYIFSPSFFYKNDDKTKSKKYYKLDSQFSEMFFVEHFIEELEEHKDYMYSEDGSILLLDKNFDKVFKAKTKGIHDWLKKQETIDLVNQIAFSDNWNKYVKSDSTSKWEMETINFYYGEHELDCVDFDSYGIVDFDTLPEEPVAIKETIKGDRVYKQFKIESIVGTVLDKNNNRHTITILTPFGKVVDVKFNKGQYAHYNKTISSIDEESGKKTRIEESWFKRGTLVYVKGFRDGQQFRARNNEGHTITKITGIRDYKYMWLQEERPLA